MIDDILTRYGLRPSTPWGTPYYSGSEVVENLTKDFNRLPPQYTTDPQTGQVVVTKTMPKPYGPPDLEEPYTNLFRSPNNPNWGMDAPLLRASWLLPEGALTGPKFLDRSTPVSDADRQMGELAGVSNIGAATSTLNPQTHWPESTFKLPTRDPSFWGDPYGPPEPMFNSITDFTTGRYHVPPTPGAWSQSYGQIGEMIPPVQPTDFDRMYRQSLLRKMI